jgi:predicted acyltransferase
MKETIPGTPPSFKRAPSIDHFRGLALVLMIIVNTAAHFTAIPGWMKHAGWDGFTFADAIAPMFLFAIGLTAGASFNRRREKHGIPKTILHFALRNALLMSFGFAGTFLLGNPLIGGEEILTLIGAAGILCIPFWFIPAYLRVIIGALLLGVYAALSAGILHPAVMLYSESGLGGWAALPAWAFIILFASWVGERFSADSRGTLAAGMIPIALVMTAAGIFGNTLIPVNKHLVSITFILLTSGIALLGYFIFYLVLDRDGGEFVPLSAPGKNSLLIYITSSILSIILSGEFALFIALLWISFNLGINILFAVFLDKKKLYLKL